MATTTTNYGFDVPTSSDLVKNGATQIALLGQDLDTFLFRPFTKNLVINGAYDIWQRGTSIAQTAANTFFADRWSGYRGGLATGATYSRQATGDTTNLPFIQYCNRMQRDSGNASTESLNTWYNAETSDSIRFAGQVITFSFYARKGANFSGDGGGNFTGYIQTGTGTDQALASGYTGIVTLITKTVQPTSTWVRYTATATVAANATQIGVQFSYTPTGTAGAADYVEFTGVMVEVGSQASPFTRAGGGLIQQELAACQRYYYRTGVGTGNTTPNVYEPLGYGSFSATTSFAGQVEFPVSMRIATGAVEFSNVALNNTIAVLPVTNVIVNAAGTKASNLNMTVASGGTALVFARIVNNNNTAGYLAWSAEL
jgi:hypothetical protein